MAEIGVFFFRGGQAILIRGKLTTGARTIIPRQVWSALSPNTGDMLVYKITRRRVVLSKASCAARGVDPFRAFHAWRSKADRKAYGRV